MKELLAEDIRMRELSLHILDLMENSISADATIIDVAVEEDRDLDLLKITVEDNGLGLQVSPEEALNPFYTTKRGKRIGLGLSLFQETAEKAGGKLKLEQSKYGGTKVTAVMKLSHLDRIPLGNIAATISTIVITNPQLDLRCRFRSSSCECNIRISDLIKELNSIECRGLEVARKVSRRIDTLIHDIDLTA